MLPGKIHSLISSFIQETACWVPTVCTVMYREQTYLRTDRDIPAATVLPFWADRKWTNKETIYCDNGRKNSSKVSEQASVGAKVSRHKPRLHEDMSLELAAEGWQPTYWKETFLGVRRPGVEGTVLTGMRCPSLGESPFSLVTSHSCRGTMCVPKLSLTSQLKNNSHMKKTVRNDMIVLPTGSSQKLS